MLNYARRIRFENDFVLPRFTMDDLYRREEPTLLNNKGQFFVDITEKSPYLRRFVEKCQDLNLTVSGDGTAPVKGGDITQAIKGDIITVGSSSRFDVNWSKHNEYVCQKGYRPVYDIVKDWNKIDKALKQFADEKKSLRTADGTKVQFHARFMVVDGRVISYNRNEVAVIMPAQVLRDLVYEYELVAIRTLRTY